MAVLPVLVVGEPVLSRVAAWVEHFDDELTALADDMVDTMDAASGVGLAAPQIGVGLRIFVYAMANSDGVPPRGVVVNPLLTLSRVPDGPPDPDAESEGCLSVPGLHFPLRRAERALVRGQNLTGAPLSFEATGWFARCMQHEMDHLNGTLYLDRLDARTARKARKVVRANGWGKPGRSWLPGVDPDPFGQRDEPAQVASPGAADEGGELSEQAAPLAPW